MEGSASIGATQSAVMRSSRFRSSRATLSTTFTDSEGDSVTGSLISSKLNLGSPHSSLTFAQPAARCSLTSAAAARASWTLLQP